MKTLFLTTQPLHQKCGEITSTRSVIVILLVIVTIFVLITYSSKNNESKSVQVIVTRHEDPRVITMAIPNHFNILNNQRMDRDVSCNSVNLTPRLNPNTAEMCAYSADEDQWISGTLQSSGQWEPILMNALEQLYISDPHLNLIDIGANIGVFSVLSALWGRKVVAVEANPDNAKKLMTTLSRNKLDKLVTVVNNAVSDVHTTVNMVVDQINRGGSIVISKKAANSSRAGIPDERRLFVRNINTIFMDELLNVVTFKKAVLKIDIEGYESVAFRRAENLLKGMNICYIFMEWKWIKDEKKGGDTFVYDLLVRHNYRPFSDPSFRLPVVDVSQFDEYNIYWKKYGC